MACVVVVTTALVTIIMFILGKALIVSRSNFQLGFHCYRAEFFVWMPTTVGAVLCLAAYNRLVSYQIALVLHLLLATCGLLFVKQYTSARNSQKFQTACNYISNESRNQIYAQRVILERMKEEKSEWTDYTIAKMMKINANVSAILGDSMNLAKWHSGQFLAKFVPFPIVRLLKSIASYATEKGLVVGALPPVMSTWYVTADEHLLNKAVTNLISNACKYGQGEPASMVMAFEKMDDKQGVIMVTVADEGCGMTPDKLHKSTEPFANIWTADGVREGTGLSLPLTKAIIELGHKGSLSLASDGVDKGVTATIRVPVQWKDRTGATRPSTDSPLWWLGGAT